MWSTPSFLSLCQALHRSGFRPPVREGQRVARGFADVGFEEFWVLPSRKLVSIVNGVGSELSVEHEKFFFVVPSVDELVDATVRSGYDLVALRFEDQRIWKLDVERPDRKQRLHAEDAILEIALAKALLAILDRTPKGDLPQYV